MLLDLRSRYAKASVALSATLAVLLVGCADQGEEPSSGDAANVRGDAEAAEPEDGDGERLHVVATTSILGDVVTQLTGDDAEVSVIMPPGVDPHAYEASAQDGATLREADLVVSAGLMLEESLVSALDAVEDEGGNVFALAEHLDPIEFDAADDHDDHADEVHAGDAADDHVDHEADDGDGEAHDDGDDNGHGHAMDPHVWFDPIRMADGVGAIAEQIAAVDVTLDDTEWTARADAYAAEIREVHGEMEAMFASIPDENRVLVTNHDSLGYLAARYDLEVLGTVIPGSSTQADTDPRAFSELVAAVEEANAPVIFAENTDSVVLAEQLASEVIGRSDLEVEVVRLYTDALGEEGSGAETYLGLLRTTGQLITDALT